MPFLWFWINSEIKVSLLHVTSMMWSSSSVSSNMPVLRFIFNKQNRSHFLLCQATLCLCAFAYDVPLVWNIFSPLIDFCHRISNHNFHWKMPPQSTKLSSCASCPKEPFWAPYPTPGDHWASTMPSFSFVTILTIFPLSPWCLAERCSRRLLSCHSITFCHLGKWLDLLTSQFLSLYKGCATTS